MVPVVGVSGVVDGIGVDSRCWRSMLLSVSVSSYTPLCGTSSSLLMMLYQRTVRVIMDIEPVRDKLVEKLLQSNQEDRRQ